MRNQHVLHQGLQSRRKSLDRIHFFRDQFVFNQDVTEKLAFVRVAEGTMVAELLQLSDVVEDGARKQQVRIGFGIMPQDHAAKIAQAEDVFQQPSVVRVVHDFGRWRALQSRHNLRVLYHGIEELPEPGIPYRSDDLEELRIELVHIFFGVREEIGGIDFAFLGPADLFDGQLQFIPVGFDARLNLYKIVALKRRRHAVKAIPHASLDAPGGVAQLQAQVGFSFPRGADFFYTDKKVRGNGLAVLETGDKALFHVPDFFLGRMPNLRPDLFLESSFSGAAATCSIGSSFTAAVSVYPGLICT